MKRLQCSAVPPQSINVVKLITWKVMSARPEIEATRDRGGVFDSPDVAAVFHSRNEPGVAVHAPSPARYVLILGRTDPIGALRLRLVSRYSMGAGGHNLRIGSAAAFSDPYHTLSNCGHATYSRNTRRGSTKSQMSVRLNQSMPEPPNQWTPVVGLKSQAVSDGGTSTTVVHAGVQAQAVELAASSGRTVTTVANELGLRDSVLRRWMEQLGGGREPTAATRRPMTQAALPSADQAAEIARPQRENERLRMERDSPSGLEVTDRRQPAS
jgi:transposase